MGVGQLRLVGHGHAVRTHFQRPLGGHGGFFLAQAARCRIARVHKGLFALVGQLLVQFLEAGLRHVHLTSHLHQLRNLLAAQLERNGRNGSDVGGDILAGVTIAAGGGPNQQPVLVVQADRQAIQLGLADVLHAVLGTQALTHPAIKVPQFVLTESIVQRQHRDPMDHFGKTGLHAAAHTPGRRLIRCQLGELRFKLLQLTEQPVVLGVRYARIVKHVVTVVMVLDGGPQIGNSLDLLGGGLAHNVVGSPVKKMPGRVRASLVTLCCWATPAGTVACGRIRGSSGGNARWSGVSSHCGARPSARRPGYAPRTGRFPT